MKPRVSIFRLRVTIHLTLTFGFHGLGHSLMNFKTALDRRVTETEKMATSIVTGGGPAITSMLGGAVSDAGGGASVFLKPARKRLATVDAGGCPLLLLSLADTQSKLHLAVGLWPHNLAVLSIGAGRPQAQV